MRTRQARAWMQTGALVAAAVFASCSGPSAPSPAVGGPTSMIPTPTPVATARYRFTFEALWSASTHPTDLPARPHFSPLIGGTHRSDVAFWMPGAPASEGIERMAELGAVSPLDAEIQAAIDDGRAQFLLRGGDIALSPDSTAFEFDIAATHPLVTLVTMVAPSPDWFVGINGLSLIRNGDWADEVAVSLAPWDAGTDSGLSYESPDEDTQPRLPIALLTGHPVANGGVVAPMGRFVFRRIS